MTASQEAIRIASRALREDGNGELMRDVNQLIRKARKYKPQPQPQSEPAVATRFSRTESGVLIMTRQRVSA